VDVVAGVSDIAEVVKMVADVVRNTREIIQAVNDGRKYLELNYPDSKDEWADLLYQMQRTVEGLAEVTKVVSAFRFSGGPAADYDTVRFNNYVIEQKAKLAELNGRLRDLKGSSGKVRDLRDALNAHSTDRKWDSMFGLLGEKGRRDAAELASVLSNFYADDEKLADTIRRMMELAEAAVKDVDAALAPAGIAHPIYIPDAAAVLGVYATIFAEPQRELNTLVQSLEETRTVLTSR
jgi:hypothetical protein